MTETKTIPKKIPLHFLHFHTLIKLADFSERSRQEIIEENDGGLIYLLDDHHSLEDTYFLARVRYDPNDEGCYYTQRILPTDHEPDLVPKLSVEVRFNYGDLIGAIIPSKEIVQGFYKTVRESEKS